MSTAVLTSTANEIITSALKKARVIAATQSISATDTANGLIALKDVLKHFQTKGLNLWKKERAILPLNTGQQRYLLGPNGADCAKRDTFVNTTLTADESSSATVIDVTSSTGMSGAPDILTANPATSTTDWAAANQGTLSISSQKLLLTNGGAAAGGANYSLATIIGHDYIANFSYEKGTSASANFTLHDANGVLSTVNLTSTGTSSLTFTATDTVTFFKIANSSVTINETSLLISMNYIDKATGDRIGIELDDGTRHWDNIVTVDSSIQVTINTGLASAATGSTSTLTVWAYETEIERPLNILNMQFATTITASEIPVELWAQEVYESQSDKTSSGTVVAWHYSPQLTDGELFVWQVASNVNQILRFTYERPILIPTVSTDVIDIPSEWILALKWMVAAELGPEYGVKTERQVLLETKANQYLNAALDHDTEQGSMDLQPDFG